MSRKTSKVADKDVGRTEHINFLRDEATASSWLLAYGITATNTLQILISAGVVYFGEDRVEFAGGYSPMMTAPDASSRIDVVSIASSSEIVVTVGVEADSPIAPAYPEANMPICQVYHRAGEIKITDEDDATNGYIYKDLRKFLRGDEISTVVSEDLQWSNDAAKSTNSTTYIKLKEIKLNESLKAVRIKFDLKSSTAPSTAYGRIYKNGVAIGTEQSQVGTDYVTKTEDFADFIKDDLIQIYVRAQSSYIAYVQNFRFYFIKQLTIFITDPTNQDL